MAMRPGMRVAMLTPAMSVKIRVDRGWDHARILSADPVARHSRGSIAELMVTRDGDPIDPAGPGILFYLYSPDLDALRVQLLEPHELAGA
jgi:hypothetical protein